MEKRKREPGGFRGRSLWGNRSSRFLLLVGWTGYFLMYTLTERLIPAEVCHPVHMWLDDLIVFQAWFVIPYVLWYGLIVFSLGFFWNRSEDSFRRLQIYFIITQVLATACYILYPTREDLRPQGFEDPDFLTRCVAFLYRVDTNTGVCPSLHVACSLGMASVWTKERGIRWYWKTVLVCLVILICLSTMFIKQHSAVDVIAAIPVCLIAEAIVYRDRYFGRKDGHGN